MVVGEFDCLPFLHFFLLVCACTPEADMDPRTPAEGSARIKRRLSRWRSSLIFGARGHQVTLFCLILRAGSFFLRHFLFLPPG